MNLGLAIFLSSIFLGIIFLFHSTKDRWNWKKIAKLTSLILLTTLVILISIWVYRFYFENNRYKTKITNKEILEAINKISDDDLRKEEIKNFKPLKITKLNEFKLGESQSDIKFMKEKPQILSEKPEIWLYGSIYNNFLLFGNNKIISIISNNYISLYFNTTEEVIMKWGNQHKKYVSLTIIKSFFSIRNTIYFLFFM